MAGAPVSAAEARKLSGDANILPAVLGSHWCRLTWSGNGVWSPADCAGHWSCQTAAALGRAVTGPSSS